MAPYVLGALLGLLAHNVFVAIVYAFDKARAKRGGRRVRERTLLLLAFFFGALGALVAMHAVRHKTRKNVFRIGVPCLLGLQLVALAGAGWALHPL